MNFWLAWWSTFLRARDFLLAIPVLGLIIIGAEGFQHVIEWLDGMYTGQLGLLAAAHDEHRLIAGSAKVIWLILVQFWVIRYCVSLSGNVALKPGRVALHKFAVVFAISVAQGLVIIWAPEIYPPGSKAQAAAASYTTILQIITFPLGLALMPWMVGAALGDRRANPAFAFRRAWGSIWWGIGLTLANVLPLMFMHYWLNLAAVGKPFAVAIAMLVLDAVTVGFLGVVTGAVNVPIAARMAARAGDQLSTDPA